MKGPSPAEIPPVPVESSPCAICGGERFAIALRRARDLVWRKPGVFTLARCLDCGLVMTRPRPTRDGLAFYYQDTYSGPGKEALQRFETTSWLGRLVAGYRLGVINRVHRLGRGDRMLDVGCSYGGQLRAAWQTSGCATSGIDIDPASIAAAVDRDRTEYRVGQLREAGYPPGAFTIITFFESLEHHRDPVETLAAAHDALAPGGLVVVEVPNYAGFWRRIFRTSWLPLLVPQHLVHFTPKTLRGALDRAGFREVLHQQTMFYPFEGVASAVLALGRLVKTSPAAAKRWWRTPLDVVVKIALAALYFVLEIPSQALLRWLGISGHQIAIARRAEEDDGPAPR